MNIPDMFNMTITEAGVVIAIILALYCIRELKENKRLYHQVDKLTFGIAIAIQAKHPEITLVNQSANGEGDHALKRDV